MAEIPCKCHIARFECKPSQKDKAELPHRALITCEPKSYLCGLAIRENNFGIPTRQEDVKNCLGIVKST